MVAVVFVLGPVDPTVEHRRGRRDPRVVGAVDTSDVRAANDAIGRKREQDVHGQRRAGRAGQLIPAGLGAGRPFLLRPCPQSSIAGDRIGVVVDGQHLRPPRLPQEQWLDGFKGGQSSGHRAADAHKLAQIAAVIAPRVVAVVVADRQARIERMHEREVQSPAVDLSPGRSPLVHGVQEVPHDLVRDQQSQQVQVTARDQNAEQRGPVGVSPLVCEGVQSVLADRVVRYLACDRPPAPHLAGYGRQPPGQLAYDRSRQHAELTCRERNRSRGRSPLDGRASWPDGPLGAVHAR